MAEHFVQPPNWEWWIALYFFCAGLAGGLYVLATIFRFRGTPRDEAMARTGFIWSFPLVVLCGIFLTIDLGKPFDFWHMMINTTPGAGGLNWKPWSPISVGTWALLVFGLFSFVAFLFASTMERRARAGDADVLPPGFVRVFNLIGSVLGLFLASYTGVVLSVSNQPVWSDSWALGALFVASGLSASAALMAWAGRSRAGASAEARLQRADGYFALLEAVALALFFVTLAMAGTLSRTFHGIYWVLWILVVLSLIPPLRALGARAPVGGGALSALVVIIGVFLMRVAVIFSAQY
jgi:formate-dependent nitrite reductase membrane component NrfD